MRASLGPRLVWLALLAPVGCGGSAAVEPDAPAGLADAREADSRSLYMPALTGPYAVGTEIRGLEDPARLEAVTPDPGDHRRIVVQLWYPAEPCPTCPPAPYLSAAEAAVGVSGFLFGVMPHFPEGWQDSVHVRAQLGAQLSSGGRLPVVVFSHGLGNLRSTYASLVEDLASHGFVVVGVSHTYDSEITAFPDGTTAGWAGDPVTWSTTLPASCFRLNGLARNWRAPLSFACWRKPISA